MNSLRRDLPASLVVFLVAVPLSLGIALASGAPIIAGLIGAVAGGIVTGLLAGSPLQVSGPAAGLTVVVAGLVHQFGWETMCLITACAGVVQLLLGWFKVARGALIIAPAVVHGMLAGIGISIALAQIHVVLGGSPQSSPVVNLLGIPKQLGLVNTQAAILGFLTIAILIVWKKLKAPSLKAIPGPLVAVVVGTVVSIVAKMDVKRVDLPETFELTKLAPPEHWGPFVVAVLTVAIIASIESLLCAVATDKLHSGVRSNLDKELRAQGTGNLVSGLLGGLPITGVIVRSSANIIAGGASRWSAIFHGVWVLIFAVFLGTVIEQIPLAVLAGLLVHVGINLVNLHHIRDLHTHNEAPIYFATVLGVTGLNLLAGVGIGLGLSVFFLLRRLSSTDVKVGQREGKWHVRIGGTLTFASVPSLSAALATIPAGHPVDIDLAVDFIDHSAFEALHGWRQNHEKTGGHVDIDETHEEWYKSATEGRPRKGKSARPLAAS
ncbi:SulP family inorganic anion transporter [Prosthecobacter sp.]|uniref:SulP family inorganic anion transporter n=1 Tax=Prosthecobacter sp. TaxID=1965333 RepID=UPI002ABC49DB|nr:SulP family inorganic anion transporter [Prosthecobacter sp.]MDZ4403198.1 SulP family inorganic anion transporter [Prosthecobacter sp.]